MREPEGKPESESERNADNAVQPLGQSAGAIDGVHPALTEQYKKIRVVNWVHVAIILLLLLNCIRQPQSGLFLLPIGGLYIWGTFSRVRSRRKLRDLSSIIARDNFVSTTVELKLNQALGVCKKYSGKLLQETRFTSPHQPINFKPPVIKPGDSFDTPFPIPANLYIDPDNQKVLAVNTSKGLLLVDYELGAGLSPWGQLALMFGISSVMLPVGIVCGFLAASSGRDPLPPRVPTGLTAKEYYDLGVRYKGAGWTELSRESLNKAIALDPNNIGKKAEMYRKTKLPHNPVPGDAVNMNIRAFNEAIFNQKGAENTWLNCIEKYPDFEWPYSNLASLYVKNKRYDEAEELYKKALELNPYYVNALIGMAQLQIAKDNKSAAEKYVRKVLEYEPDNAEAQILKLAVTIKDENESK